MVAWRASGLKLPPLLIGQSTTTIGKKKKNTKVKSPRLLSSKSLQFHPEESAIQSSSPVAVSTKGQTKCSGNQ
uniref:Uncharacterized protein n=1 Tax=Arundo donax TaxID=35708 RepID=A0A0A8YTI9_ARUDO